jgi:hypothetical protein
MFVFGVVVIEVWETDLPVWGFVLALLIVRFVSSFLIMHFLPEFHIRCLLAFVYTLPLSVIHATNEYREAIGAMEGDFFVVTLLINEQSPAGHPTLNSKRGFIILNQ